jgi:hypothetical protein
MNSRDHPRVHSDDTEKAYDWLLTIEFYVISGVMRKDSAALFGPSISSILHALPRLINMPEPKSLLPNLIPFLFSSFVSPSVF